MTLTRTETVIVVMTVVWAVTLEFTVAKDYDYNHDQGGNHVGLQAVGAQ